MVPVNTWALAKFTYAFALMELWVVITRWRSCTVILHTLSLFVCFVLLHTSVLKSDPSVLHEDLVLLSSLMSEVRISIGICFDFVSVGNFSLMFDISRSFINFIRHLLVACWSTGFQFPLYKTLFPFCWNLSLASPTRFLVFRSFA